MHQLGAGRRGAHACARSCARACARARAARGRTAPGRARCIGERRERAARVTRADGQGGIATLDESPFPSVAISGETPRAPSRHLGKMWPMVAIAPPWLHSDHVWPSLAKMARSLRVGARIRHASGAVPHHQPIEQLHAWPQLQRPAPQAHCNSGRSVPQTLIRSPNSSERSLVGKLAEIAQIG